MIAVFDRAQIKRQRIRALTSFKNHDFLFEWAMKQIADRLSVVQRKFPLCVQIGARGSSLPAAGFGVEQQIVMDNTVNAAVIAEEDFFPFAPQSLDLVVSALNLHTVNDLPGALLQIKQALKPDGLFIAAIMGGETLFELRNCLAEAELEITGGVSPRVAPFADKPQMGGLLQRAGFSLPVVDSDIVTVTYDSIFPLMRDLRGMGEGNAVTERRKHFTPRKIFLRAGELYAQKFSDPDGRIRASFEIIFLIGWAPHDSQQKPLRPGSAKTRLADFLGTEEIGTGEKTQLIHIVPILRDNYCYLIEGADKNCIIVDPGQVTPVESYIVQYGLKPVLILNTHHHADHVAGNAELKTKYNISVIGPSAEKTKIPHVDKGVAEADIIEQSGMTLSVVETPGHTKGHVVFTAREKGALFSGDTLFSMGCGRLLEGTAEEMFASLQKLKSLPPETEIYCGHEYTKSNGEFALSIEPDNEDIQSRMKDVVKLYTNNRPSLPVTLATELKTNPFLRSTDVATFARRRMQKDNF